MVTHDHVISLIVFYLLVMIAPALSGGTPPIITEQSPGVYYFLTGTSHDFKCTATGDSPISYEWKVAGGKNLVFSGPSVTDGGFGIESVEAEGAYQCFAENEYGIAVSDFTYLRRAALTAPPVDEDAETYEGNAYDSLMIPCGGQGSVPEGTFHWELVPEQGSTYPLLLSSRVNQDDDGNLYFAQLSSDDIKNGAIYRCSIFNPVLDMSATRRRAIVNVNPATSNADRAPQPLFSSQTNTVVLEGKQLRLRCFFSGKGLPTIEWQRTNGELPPGRHTYEGYQSELVIDDVIRADAGEYTCTGTNNAGSETITFRVTVESIPKFNGDKKPQAQSVMEGGTATIYCETMAEPPATVQWYTNGQPLNSSSSLGDRWRLEMAGTRLTVTDACDSCPDGGSDVMAIQCNASNSHGYVFASGYLSVGSTTDSAVSLKSTHNCLLNIIVVITALTSFIHHWTAP